MKISKSSRHQKIIGDFGESLICNWLSRSGFEVTIVDHTGIDIVAYNLAADRRLGITVRSRTRSVGNEDTHVNILSCRKNKDDRKKVREACTAFGCEPWVAVYVETLEFADLYMTSLEHYDRKYRGSKSKVTNDWKMGEKHKQQYMTDPEVKHVRISFYATNWDWGS